MSQFSEKFDKMINELNEPNLPRTSLTQNRGTWKTKMVTIAKSRVKDVEQNEEAKPLLNGALKTDDTVSYIIASNSDNVKLTQRNWSNNRLASLIFFLVEMRDRFIFCRLNVVR